MKQNHVVIMAGGVGSRFWPLSTPEFPKQFIDILGVGRTLIQLTFDRFRGIADPQNVWVVTNAKYVDIVREQLPDIPAENILAEPAARNTAPCIAWAGWKINKKTPNANIVVTPSDAIVMDVHSFQSIIREALDYTANHQAIVTLGIRPNRPETGYGYVHMDQQETGNIYKVWEFKEKPNHETAERYLADGNYLWNAGIFVWNVQTLTEGIRTYAPQIADIMDQMELETSACAEPVEVKPFETSEIRAKRLFPLCEKISIDYAIMEKHPRVYTIPSDFGWSDLGNWQSLHEKLQKDENNNAVVGNAKLVECHDCVVHIEGAKLACGEQGRTILQGLDGYIVSEKNGQFLVCKRSEEQRIKEWNE